MQNLAVSRRLTRPGEARHAGPILREVLQDPLVRQAAARALLSIDARATRELVPILVEGFTGPHAADVARSSVEVLARLGADTPGVLSALVRALLDNRTHGTAREALDRFAAPGAIAVPELVKLLRGPTEELVRQSSAAALGAYGARASAAIPELRQALADPSPRVRENAGMALKAIERR